MISLLLVNCSTTKKSTASNDNKITIKGKIEVSTTYCGGEQPTKEMLEEEGRKNPLTDYKLYIRAGKINDINAPIVDSTLTNHNGEFEFNLLPGEYVLFNSIQKNKDIIKLYKEGTYDVNETCIEKWWQNGISQLSINNELTDDLYFYFRKDCFVDLGMGCVMYSGPYPP